MKLPYTLLAVDPDIINLQKLSHIFKGTCDVLAAHSGVEALRLFFRQPVQVIISDYHLKSGMDGVELFQKIKRVNPNTIRFILTSAEEQQNLTHAIHQGGVNGYFIKPWLPRELLQTVHLALKRHHSFKCLPQQMNHHFSNMPNQPTSPQRAAHLRPLFPTIPLSKHDLKKELFFHRKKELFSQMQSGGISKIPPAPLLKFKHNPYQEGYSSYQAYDLHKGRKLNLTDVSASKLFAFIDTDIRNLLTRNNITYTSFKDKKDFLLKVDLQRIRSAIISLVKNSVNTIQQISKYIKPYISFRMGIHSDGVQFSIIQTALEMSSQFAASFIAAVPRGLKYVQKTIEAHQGNLFFFSDNKHGNQIILRLKRYQDIAAQPALNPKQAPIFAVG